MKECQHVRGKRALPGVLGGLPALLIVRVAIEGAWPGHWDCELEKMCSGRTGLQQMSSLRREPRKTRPPSHA